MRIPSFVPFFGKRTALQRIAAITPIILPRDAEAEARAIIDELSAAPIDARVKIARDAGLPHTAKKLGPHARTVLEVLIDDDLLREAFGIATFGEWTALDRAGCIVFTVARARRLSPALLWHVLPSIEAQSEIYEVFAPLYRSEAPDRLALMGSILFDNETARRVFGDARFVDLALATLATDVRASCILLGMNASPRAVDELRAVLEHVPADDNRWSATEEGAVCAIDALADALEHDAFIDVLARFLAAQPRRLVPYMYLSMRIAQYAIALDQHPLVRENVSLRGAIAQTAMPPPMPVG